MEGKVLRSKCIDSVVNKEIDAESDNEIEDVTEDVVNVPLPHSECLELLDKLIQSLIKN